MQIRVTLQTRAHQMRNAVQARARDLARTQEEVSTGRKLLRPSDDAIAARQSLLNRAQLAQIDQFVSNIDLGVADLNTADALLVNVADDITRAKEVAIAMGNDSVGPAARRASGLEVAAILDDLLALGNSTFRGRHLFGGENTVTAPFTRTGTDIVYSGTDQGIRRRISQDQPLVETTLPGSQIFFTARNDQNVVQDGIFQTVRALKQALDANDGEAIRNALPSLQKDFERVLAARAMLGARADRLQKTQERLLDLKQEIQTLQATTEDADLAESISDLQLRQTALQATLGVSGQIVPLSLLDFLIR